MVSELWRYSLVEAVVLSIYFEAMQWILKSSESGLSLLNEGSMFSVTKYSDELTGYEESNEESYVDIYMSVGTKIDIIYGIRLIALIAMSKDPGCDSEWSPGEYLDSSYDKKHGSVRRVSSREYTDSFDEAIIALYGHSVWKFTPKTL